MLRNGGLLCVECALDKADTVFEEGADTKSEQLRKENEKLYKIVGQQKVEIDFLKEASSNLGL
jgi:hypothetical protein